MGIGKTRKTEQTQQVDPQMARESHALLNLLRLTGGAGYEPNRGVTKAAITPKEETAFNMADAAARAFGFSIPEAGTSPMPEAITNDIGIKGHRASDLYDETMSNVSQGYKDMMKQFFNVFGQQTPYEHYNPGGGGKK